KVWWPQGTAKYLPGPLLTVDPQGRVWLAFHHRRAVEGPGANQQQRVRNYWEAYVTHYEGSAWAPAVALPDSWTRISAVQSIAPASDGRMWLACNTDGRKPPDTHAPVKNDVYVTALAAPRTAVYAALPTPP